MQLMLGTVQFGLDYGISNSNGKVSEEDVLKILELCSANDINYLDTAPMYGDSESRIGKNLTHKEQFKIVTKTPHLLGADSDTILKSFHSSLKNLEVNSVYSLMFHNADDLFCPLADDYFKKIESLKGEHKISKIGCSVYSPDQLEKIIERYDVDLVQLPMNIFDQRFYREGLLTKLKEKKVEIHTRSLFLQGLIFCELEKLDPFFDPVKSKLAKFQNKINEMGISPLEASYSFIKSFPEIDNVLIGVVDPTQLQENLSAFNIEQKIDFHECHIENELFINPSKWSLRK